MLTDANGLSGLCSNGSAPFDYSTKNGVSNASDCNYYCEKFDTTGLLGFNWSLNSQQCDCLYEDGMNPVHPESNCGDIFDTCSHDNSGVGPIVTVDRGSQLAQESICYKYLQNEQRKCCR